MPVNQRLSQYSTNVPAPQCICCRLTAGVKCLNPSCNFSINSKRVRKTCHYHPMVIYMFDLVHCPKCGGDTLHELIALPTNGGREESHG